ncbi:FAD-linked oxidoreductase-like protein [Zopfochytrium polystomum]|nr:FAD-linked oxidoreductase-like protein [Zopfochytrium polystomum]
MAVWPAFCAAIRPAAPLLSAFAQRRIGRYVGTLSLINSYAVLQLCGFRPLVDWAETILSAAERLHLSWLVHWVVKQTFFKHFCGGEDLKEVVPTMRRLESRNIGSILDLAMEADIDSQEGQSLTPKAVQDQSAKVADLMLDAIQIASKSRGAFIALKVTAFFPPVLLLEWSNALYRVRDAFNVAATGSLALGELNRVIAAAAHAGVRVMVDAEQTYFQPAIDDVTKILSATHNIGSPRAMPVVFGTYQLYLRDALSRLQTDADGFRRARIPFGVKIVRGAYMESERERAAEMGYPDPVQPSIAATHAAYDSAIDGLVERVRAATKGDVNTPAVQFVIASHNVGSVGRGIKALSDAGLGKSGKSDDESAVAPVAFAQLMGMQDGTTFSIAASGYKAFKVSDLQYVPYGPIKVTIPYLLRRAQENSAVLGGVADDKRNLAKELRLRFVPWAKA